MLFNLNLVNDEIRYSITHWYQPIFCLKNNSIIGYEALLRDSSRLQVSPIEIFREADEKGQRNILDLVSVKTAIETFKDESNTLFVNIYPSTLLKKGFLHWWDIHISPIVPVVLELSENESIMEWKELKVITKELKARGIKIAVDDVSSGFSSIQEYIELEPDFMKLDIYLAEGLSRNIKKQKIVKSLVDLFSDTTKIIIEGIEKEEDLNIARLLGIPYAQGYFLGKPSPIISLQNNTEI